MKVFVGLGNPGRQYEGTRHNVGFEVVDELARRMKVKFSRSWTLRARTATCMLGSGEALLVKPETFMNRTGATVQALLRKKGVKPADLVVVVDDADLVPGQLRIRPRGSAGHHNGLKSIIGSIGSDDFPRLRVGIGAKPAGGDMAAFVLSRFTAEERKLMDRAVQEAADALEALASGNLEAAMNRFNRKN